MLMTNAKRYLFILFFSLFLQFHASAQKTLKVNIRATGDTVNTDVYTPAEARPGESELVLPMQYGSYEIQNQKALQKLKGAVIVEIKLVYTAYSLMATSRNGNLWPSKNAAVIMRRPGYSMAL
jgi:hypothetical protein